MPGPCSRGRDAAPGLLAAAAFLALAATPAAADEDGASFWVPGQFASFAAVAPELGFSLPVQSYFYTGRADGELGRGSAMSYDFETQYFGQFISPTYTSARKFLGATPSISLTVNPAWNGASANIRDGAVTEAGSDAVAGFGDIYPMAQLFWSAGSSNWMAYVTGDVPVGSYDPQRLSNLGLGHGAIDVGGAYTYLNTTTGWEFSATAGVTYNMKNVETDYTSGIDSHLDVGISRFLNEQFFLGAAGYAYVQLTPDKGQPPELGNFESRTFGLGPQLGYNFMEGGVAIYTNLRAYAEFDVKNRPKGGAIFLTVDVPVSALQNTHKS